MLSFPRFTVTKATVSVLNLALPASYIHFSHSLRKTIADLRLNKKIKLINQIKMINFVAKAFFSEN
jgi:hypothetical protein